MFHFSCGKTQPLWLWGVILFILLADRVHCGGDDDKEEDKKEDKGVPQLIESPSSILPEADYTQETVGELSRPPGSSTSSSLSALLVIPTPATLLVLVRKT